MKAALLLLALSSVAVAQQPKPSTSFRLLESLHVAGAALDTGVTLHNLNNGCHEQNPLLGAHPSAAHVVAFEAAISAGELVVAHLLRNRHHGRLAALLLGESAAEHGTAVGFSMQARCF